MAKYSSNKKKYFSFYSYRFFFSVFSGHFGLWLDADLYRGTSVRCQTYDNDPLASSDDFIVKNLEAWIFTQGCGMQLDRSVCLIVFVDPSPPFRTKKKNPLFSQNPQNNPSFLDRCIHPSFELRTICIKKQQLGRPISRKHRSRSDTKEFLGVGGKEKNNPS